MRPFYACGTADHDVSRRSFLQGSVAAGAGLLGFSGMVHARTAETLASTQKQVVVFYLAGGLSQLESWDPKPGTDNGGPFERIATSVPGIEICELLPYTAQQMHHLSIIRSLNHKEGDHGKGDYIMQTGYRKAPGFEYPYLGSCFSKQLSPPDSPLPGYVHINGGGSKDEAAFLGPQHAPLSVNNGGPANMERIGGLTPEHDQQRRELRAKLSGRFAAGRRKADTEAYGTSFDQAAKLMAQKQAFDFSSVGSPGDVERYGKHEFAKHCLMARHLLDHGLTFVKVTHTNYDTHSENFNFHLEQLGEFDRPFATFVADLADRGRLQNTLIIVMSEFGRTPKINPRVGRDHWGNAWSIALGGCGIKPGVAVGKTNDNGTQVIDREVDGGHLFHTYYRAVGLDATKNFYDNGRPVAKADPKTSAIEEVLA